MKTCDIIAYVSRRTAKKGIAAICACGLVQLGYQPERKTGAIIHGVLIYRKEKP